MRRFIYTVSISAAAVLMCHAAQGQSPYRYVNPARSAAVRRPAVSPYVNLLQGNDAGVSNYFTQVRPMLRQGLVNTQQSANIQSLQHQVAGATAAGQTGSVGIRQTGHITTFRNYSHFFPSLVNRNAPGGQPARR